jgi:hypothetical protein
MGTSIKPLSVLRVPELASRRELFVVRPLRSNHVITRETLAHNSVKENHEHDGSMGLQERNV